MAPNMTLSANGGGLPEIEIRQAEREDAETLATLLADMDDDVEQLPIDARRMGVILDEMAAYPCFHAYLVEENGIPVASFSLMIFSSPTHQGARQAMLDAVVVSRARRGVGIGTAMVGRALDMAREQGCYKMTLSSNLKRVDAHRLYRQIGFSQHGISFSILLGNSAS